MQVFTLGNDFDPDGDGFNVVSVVTPAHGTVDQHRLRVQLHTQPSASPASNITYTPPRQPRPDLHRTRHLVGRHRHARPADPAPRRRLHVRLPRLLGVVHDRPAALQRQRPARTNVDRRRRVRTVHDGILSGNLASGFTYTPSTDPALSTPTTPSTTSSPTPTATSPKRTSSSASSPPATPTSHQSPFRTPRHRMGPRCRCSTIAQRLRSRRRHVQRRQRRHPGPRHRFQHRLRVLNYTPNPGFSGIEHHLHAPRQPRPPRIRARSRQRQHDRPTADRPVSVLHGRAGRCS